MRYLRGLHQVADYEATTVSQDGQVLSMSERVTTSNPPELRKAWYPGIELGGGWNFQFSELRISPEIRYTRWTANVASDGRPLQFPANRLELLVGITYGLSRR